MIGRLAGVVVYRGADHVVIDVRGVGYVVTVSDRTLATLPPVGQAVALWTELLVREDLLQLFGFATLAEKEWHRLLMSVQGVGAKASMAILGALGGEGLSRALALGDWASIARAKGVGPKTAQRVAMELKDKAPMVMALAGAAGSGPASAPGPAAEAEAEAGAEVIEPPARPARTPARPDNTAAVAEALSALGNLGYGPSEAAAAVAEAAGEAPGAATPALIRAALQKLAPR
jgi:Holliday junction DNA helicase RuvA